MPKLTNVTRCKKYNTSKGFYSGVPGAKFYTCHCLMCGKYHRQFLLWKGPGNIPHKYCPDCSRVLLYWDIDVDMCFGRSLMGLKRNGVELAKTISIDELESLGQDVDDD